MMKIGAHQSVAGGIDKAIDRAHTDECECIQLFVKSPNRWNAPQIDESVKNNFLSKGEEFGFNNITAHSAYLINLASPKDDVYENSIAAITDELKRCDELLIPYNVMHPGSPLDSGFESGLERIIYAINDIYSNDDLSCMILLESTAGMGTSIGGDLEHLEAIIASLNKPDKVGICLDTCHMYSAGYDLVNKYDEVVDEIVSRFGDKLKVFHLNDSKNPYNSRKDRHELLGKGEIGIDLFKNMAKDKRLAGVLGILETPNEVYLEEVRLLKSFRQDK